VISAITAGTLGNFDLGVPVMPGTNPSIVGLPSGGYEVAYQDPNGHLGLTGTDGFRVKVFMAPGSSPSMASLPNDDFAIAYQSQNGTELTYSSDPAIITGGNGWPMQPTTSPSIAATPAGPTSGRSHGHRHDIGERVLAPATLSPSAGTAAARH
jgi:hypothetical protein